MADDNKRGLLSFLFHIRYDEETRKELHRNEKAVMQSFGLSEPVQALIVQIGEQASSGCASPADRENARAVWKQLFDEHLSKELVEDQGAIW